MKEDLRELPEVGLDPRKPDLSPKEDYTDELNEKSPNTKNFNQYTKQEVKFMNDTGRSTTPKFPKGPSGLYQDKDDEKIKSLLVYNLKRRHNQTLKSVPISYSFTQRNNEIFAKQTSSKNIKTHKLADKLDSNIHTKVSDEICEEITSNDDKPLNHFTVSNRFYNESQFPNSLNIDQRKNIPKLASIKKPQTFSFINTAEGSSIKTDFRNATMQFVPVGKSYKIPNKTLNSEANTPK